MNLIFKVAVGSMLSSAAVVSADVIYQTCSDTQNIEVDGLLRHNGEMTFSSSANIFGENGPLLVYRSDLSTAEVNARYDISQAEGLGTLEVGGDTPLIEEAKGMPFDKAFVVGSEGEVDESPKYGAFRVKSTAGSTPATYEHIVYWWPKEHQENAQDYLDDSSIWQNKTIWHFYTGTKADDLARFHNSFGGFFNSGEYFTGSSLVGTSFSSYGLYPSYGDADYTLDYRSSYVEPHKFISQTYIKHSASEDGSGVIDGYMRDVNDASVGHWVKTDSRTAIVSPTEPHLGPDQFTMPGYTRGFYTQKDAHLYFGDIYIAHGEGAAARVELVNNKDYLLANKVSPFTIESWSSNSISAKSKLGIFSTNGSGDDDLYFAVHNEFNDLIAMVEYCKRIEME